MPPSQPTEAPDLDSPGQQSGDRQRAERAQRAIPVPGARGLPPDFLEDDSQRPAEDVMVGVDRVLSEPPENQDRTEDILERLMFESRSRLAYGALKQIRNQRSEEL